MEADHDVLHKVDYHLAFDLAPVGLVLSSNRSIVDCNQHVCEMFGTPRERLVGQSFRVLYPSADEFERIGARMLPILNRSGRYADNRIMKRLDLVARSTTRNEHATTARRTLQKRLQRSRHPVEIPRRHARLITHTPEIALRGIRGLTHAVR